jgi:hypothetical protein
VTEQQWRACPDPQKMLEYLRGKASQRKLRLFAAACCRRVWGSLGEAQRRPAVEVVERFAEGAASGDDVAGCWRALAGREGFTTSDPGLKALLVLNAEDAWDAGKWVPVFAAEAVGWAAPRERHSQCDLLHCMFGNPFRPVLLDAEWLTPTVLALARSAYEERTLPEGTLDAGRLAVLADALEEAGCDNAEVLAHLRGPGPHVRGCFAVDSLLGKE